VCLREHADAFVRQAHLLAVGDEDVRAALSTALGS